MIRSWPTSRRLRTNLPASAEFVSAAHDDTFAYVFVTMPAEEQYMCHTSTVCVLLAQSILYAYCIPGGPFNARVSE